MPKLIDYFARYDLIREAVVRVAAREGGRITPDQLVSCLDLHLEEISALPEAA